MAGEELREMTESKDSDQVSHVNTSLGLRQMTVAGQQNQVLRVSMRL